MDLVASLLKPKGLPDCDVCQKISTVCTWSKLGYCSETLGSINDLLASNCSVHAPVVRHFAENCRINGVQDSAVVGISRHYPPSHIDLFIEHIPGPEQGPDYNELLEVLSSSLGQRLDPEWIEPEILTKWYRRCKDRHGSACASPPYLALLPAPVPQYFIDVVDQCLVPAKQGIPYVALSYVHSHNNWLKSALDNIDVLQKPGALLTDLERRPKTLYDAVNLLTIIGERYLWVDGLSTAELSPSQKQLQKTSIFAHAELAIVAIDGADEDYGLRGIKELPEAMPRDLKQSIIPFGDQQLLVRNFQGDTNRTSPRPTYFESGSTLEEYLYSRRRLVFNKNSVVFECRLHTRPEDVHPVSERMSWDGHYLEFMHHNGFPSLTVYLYLVNLVNERRFASANDVLPAFAGTLSTLHGVMPGGFFHGLPKMFFDVALLWQPEGKMTRRPISADTTSPAPPSWSWAAWDGKIDIWSWATGNDFSASSRGLIAKSRSSTVPITVWYAVDDLSGEKRRIDVQWALWRERFKDESTPLPPGWSRKKHTPGSDSAIRDDKAPDGYGKYLYEYGKYLHGVKSGNPGYWFPVPLSDPNPAVDLAPDPRYLFGHVAKTTLRARLEEDDDATCVSLVDAEGKWAGVLGINSLPDKPADGAELDLVAISRGSCPNGEDDTSWSVIDRFEKPHRPSGKYEFYNVLWVKWVDGVAYRHGLGRVSKAALDAQQLEDIDLVLG